MSSPRIRRCLEPGASVILGSVDAQGSPSVCRAVALTSIDDLQSATVYVPVATSHEVITNIAETGRLAVVTTHPVDHCSTQLKGVAQVTRLAREDEALLVRALFGRFGDVLNSLGYPPRLTKAATQWPAFAIEMRVDDIFEQTPGPNAGMRLR